MSRKRLLPEVTALKKVELSLILQGKEFNRKFLNCRNCKFCWENTPGGRPGGNSSRRRQRIWSKMIYNYTTYKLEPNPNPKPDEKWGWHCSRYAGSPSHAFLRFKVVRTNAEGQEIKRTYRRAADGRYTDDADTEKGEKDTLIFRPKGKTWDFRVCRRFESAPRN